MAFESKNTKIAQAVKETIEEKKETAVAESDFLSNISAIEKEKKKQFKCKKMCFNSHCCSTCNSRGV